MKTYYFPNSEYADTVFGSEMPICIDKDELHRLANEWSNYDENGQSESDVIDRFHEATESEIEEYGVYDS